MVAVQPRRVEEGLSQEQLARQDHLLLPELENQLDDQFPDGWYWDGDIHWHLALARHNWQEYVANH